MDRKSVNSFVNLCKIFEMRIKLDKEKGVETSKDVLDNFEKYSIKIDNSYNTDFQKNLKPLIAPAKTIEKEKERLQRLITLLEDRLCKRLELEDKFYATTGNMINGLQLIISDSELNSKKRRLEIITSYLDTEKEISDLRESIANLKELLIKDEDSLEEYKNKNKTMEDDLYLSFISYLKKIGYDKEFDEKTLTEDLTDISKETTEAKETLDITKESVSAINSEEIDEDYKSYIDEAEQNYKLLKNKEILLKMYILILNIDEDFECLFDKRDNVKKLLEEKKAINYDKDNNLLEDFESILLDQLESLEYEKELLENITNYNTRIDFKEGRLDELDKATKDEDTLEVLTEYGLIESYEVEELDCNGNDSIEDTCKEKTIEESNIETENEIAKEPNPNRIMEIKDYPESFNMGLARLKAENILDEFNKKINNKPTINEEKSDSILSESIEQDNSSTNTSKLAIDDNKLKEDSKKDKELSDISNLSLNKEPVWDLPDTSNKVMVDETVNKERKIDLGLELENVKPPEFEDTNDKPEEITFDSNVMPSIDNGKNDGFFEGPLPTISDLNISGDKSIENNNQSFEDFNLEITNNSNINENILSITNEPNNLPIWDTNIPNDNPIDQNSGSDSSEPFWTPIGDNNTSSSNTSINFIDMGKQVI